MEIETTRRRFASIIWRLARMSPRSMRFASETSCSAVSSSTRPISRRYSRSESRLGSTVRSMPAALSSGPGIAIGVFPSASVISTPCSTR